MKLFSEIRTNKKTTDNVLAEGTTDQVMPNVLVLRRKAIRTYPDGIKVGLYYSDKLKKYVSVSFGDDTLNPPEDDKGDMK